MLENTGLIRTGYNLLTDIPEAELKTNIFEAFIIYSIHF